MRKLSILSYGGGQDSTAILIKLIHDLDFRKKYAPEDLLVIFSDTGDEHPHTYKYIEEVIKPLCDRHSIEFIWLTPDMGFHSEAWPSLMGQFYRNDNIMGCGFGQTCTDNLKIKPIYRAVCRYVNERYLYGMSREHGKVAFYDYYHRYGHKINVLLGIAREEERRLDQDWKESKYTPKWMKDCFEKDYPLIDEGMNRRDCQEYISSMGYQVPFPSNCMRCHHMSKQELVWLERNYPEKFNEWVDREAAKILKNAWKVKEGKIKSNLGVKGEKLLPELLEEAKAQFGHWTNEELEDYKFSHGHCVKSSY